jgi:hypothetical protein
MPRDRIEVGCKWDADVEMGKRVEERKWGRQDHRAGLPFLSPEPRHHHSSIA